MARAILSRLGFALLSLLFLLAIVFGAVRLTGDPLNLLLPETATEADFARAREALGLDKSVPEQFVIYLGQVLQLDLGRSIRGGTGYADQDLNPGVAELIAMRLPNTLVLGAAALLLVLVIGIPLGIYSAYRRDGVLDHAARAFTTLGQSAPNFWVGLLLILVFAVHFKLLPAGGLGGLGIVLPAVTLAFRPIAGLTRLLRSSMIEALNSDYVTFLRIKGLPERSMLWKHALRNAGLTSLTFVGILIASLFTGSVLVETVFVWPGVGRLMIEAVEYRDFPLAQGCMLLLGSAFIGINLLVDLLYMVLNPRLRAA